MSDIVERLLDNAAQPTSIYSDALMREAAAEITRLRERDEEVREELADAWPEDREAVLAGDPVALIAKLIQERDEAICDHEAARWLVEEAGKIAAYYANAVNYRSRKTLAPAVMYERGNLAQLLLAKIATADPTRGKP